MSSRAITILLACALTLSILAVSALPTATKHALHTQGALHPWLHLIGFALLAFLFLSVTRSIPLRLVFLAALLLFGYGTEARESRKDGWPIEQKDVYTDGLGVLLGATLSFLPRRQHSP
ncbi:MAG TPA: hypothetical protein VKV02_11875 [Acidobacteriaceae bacterium]|nr:hypothetical protein [Acidobacteriaceae bacterium]